MKPNPNVAAAAEALVKAGACMTVAGVIAMAMGSVSSVIGGPGALAVVAIGVTVSEYSFVT